MSSLVSIDSAEVLVLLSGGIDSTACVNFYVEFGRPPCGVFVDYGQPAARDEILAAKAVAKYYAIPLLCLKWKGWTRKAAGLIPARNAFLVSVALMERPRAVSVISIGIHRGSSYEDCSPLFLSEMQHTVDLYERGRVRLAAPFIDFSKQEIYSYCLSKHVPIEVTYSCEAGGDMPCGECLSCKDREALGART